MAKVNVYVNVNVIDAEAVENLVATNVVHGPVYIVKVVEDEVRKDETIVAEADETWQMVDNVINACIPWRIIVMSGLYHRTKVREFGETRRMRL